jgi:RND family efflux transporter MFP subunit
MARVAARVVVPGCLIGAAPAPSAAPVLIENNRFDCVIEPYDTVNLASSVEGVLVEVNVDRGDRVTKGQLLAQIDSGVEEAAAELARVRAASTASVESRRAQFEFQRAKLLRNRDLASKNMVSQEELEEIETQMEIAELDLKQAEVEKELEKLEVERATSLLERRKIFSPFDGVVIDKLLAAGEFVDGDAKVLRVARMNPLRVQVRVPAALYSGIQPGMKGEVSPKVAVGGIYPATVSDRDDVMDPDESTFRVRLELENPDYRLPAGVKCDVRFLP